MTRFAATKIVVFAFNYADRIMEAVPYVRYSAERSLCFLGELRDPAVQAVVITSEPIDPDTLEYHFHEVMQFDEDLARSARGRLTLLTPRPRPSRTLDELALDDERVMNVLRAAVRESDATTIVHFMASAALDRMAIELGARLEEGDCAFVARWGSKAGGKEILRQAGVPVPAGPARVLRSEAEVVHAIARLGEDDGQRPRRALVKLNEDKWAASIGNVRVDCAALRRTGDIIGSADTARMSADDFHRELIEGGAIVEEFMEDVTSSPSAQGSIGADGTVKVNACHDQVLDDGQYWGCRFPAKGEWRPALMDAVMRTGAVLARLGHRGTFGIDFVLSDARGPLAVEVNLRKVGPSHVLKYAEALVGREVDQDGLLRTDDGLTTCYVHGRMLAPEALGALEPREAVERLRRENLLYRRDTGKGVALHVLGALRACGFVELTALAPTLEEADTCYKAAESVLMGNGARAA